MKICFFSDVHGNSRAFDSFMDCGLWSDCDYLIFGGDIFGYYYGAIDIVDRLIKLDTIIAIMGNHDKMFIEMLDGVISENYLSKKYGSSYVYDKERIDRRKINYISEMKNYFEINDEGRKIGFFHGGPDNFLEQRIYPDTVIEDTSNFDKYDVIFVGHTHHKMDRNVGKCRVINPGSIGQQRDGKGCSFVIYDTITDVLRYCTIEFDVDKLIKEIHKKEPDIKNQNKLIEVLTRKSLV